MPIPTTREQFKQLCLENLGEPVIDINVDDKQVENQIDLALRYWYDYHMDGTEKQYYKHIITTDDIANRYVTIPENIIGVVNMFNMGDSLGSSDMFNIRYQIALNDLYTLTNFSLVPYYMTMQHLRAIEEILVGRKPMRYNRHTNKAYVDMDWNTVNAGEYIIFECYQIVDPTDYPDIWKDWWLTRYCTALIKKQWGNNLKKFSGLMMAGGVQLNGQQIYNEAVDEIAQLEHDMVHSFSLPVMDLIG
jgi:hypothetical protein